MVIGANMQQKRRLKAVKAQPEYNLTGKLIFKGKPAAKAEFKKVFVPNQTGDKHTFKFSDIEALSMVEELSAKTGIRPFLGDFDPNTVIEINHLGELMRADDHEVVAFFGDGGSSVNLETKQLLINGDGWSINLTLAVQ